MADFTGQRAGEILFKPRPLFQNPDLCSAGGVSAAEDRSRRCLLKQGGIVPVVQPFSGLRNARSSRQAPTISGCFIRSFGKRTNAISDSSSVRTRLRLPIGMRTIRVPAASAYPTEAESERLMGLPPGLDEVWRRRQRRSAAPAAMPRSEMPSRCPVLSISWQVSQKSWDKERRFLACNMLHFTHFSCCF